MNVAIIVAAGAGQRMASARAKQFLNLGGEPVLVHALRSFERCAEVDEVILVLPETERKTFSSQLSAFGLEKVKRNIAGGQERQDSVFLGLQLIEPQRTEIVIIHDGVRPLVTSEQITGVIQQAREVGAALLAAPATDTVKEVQDCRVVNTLDRRRVYLVQTPQAFRADIILAAHQRARAQGLRATDDAALVEQCGFPVAVVEGTWENIKITRPEDLALAEFLLSKRVEQ
jgi:2-C-methyl-D-erythritol 4-phosphate cytidylyltransferase